MKDFAGRTAFITGGASGIGPGRVQAFLSAGRVLGPASVPASVDFVSTARVDS